MINIRNVEEKNTILSSLKNIPYNTKQEQISILNGNTLKLKILATFPINDSNLLNKEIINIILDILQNVAKNLMSVGSTEDERTQFKSQFSDADGYNTLVYLLSVYEDKKYKERISIILGRFYYDIEIPKEKIIIIDILINSLKEYIENKENNSDENHISNILGAMINSTLNQKNKQIFYDKGIIDILLVLISNSKGVIFRNSVALLINICLISSNEVKNAIIKKDIFILLHKRLSELSPSPPQQIKPDNYFSVYCIIGSVYDLLSSNLSGVIPFLNSPLIPVFYSTLESSISLLNTSSDQDLQNIFRFICGSFCSCAKLPYENISLFIEMKGEDSMLNVIEKYINDIKENKKRLPEDGVEDVSISIYNVTVNSFNESASGEKNKVKNIFDENNKLNRMVDVCKYLISQPPSSPQQKRITNYISLSICFLLKSERPSPSLGSILAYVDNLKTSPPHPNGFEVSKAAQKSWNEMIGADECLQIFKNE
jgi:hypothetical protein